MTGISRAPLTPDDLDDETYKERARLGEAGRLVAGLRDAIARGRGYEDSVAGLIARMLDEGMWRERKDARFGRVIRHDSFHSLVTTLPPDGLGHTREEIDRIIRNAGAEHSSLIARMWEGAPQPTLSEAMTGNKNAAKKRADNSSSDTTAVSGKQERGRVYLARRLERDAPEVHARLCQGEFKSVRAAAIEAGIVKVKTPIEKAISLLDRLDRRSLLKLRIEVERLLEASRSRRKKAAP
jgi:hypothetical protein